VKVSVFVKPGSKKGPLIELSEQGEELVVFLKNRAVDGAANKELVEQLAKHFGVAKSRVSILRGHTSRNKLVEVDV
jgi:uncharacterized protein (TIGR00251 family)